MITVYYLDDESELCRIFTDLFTTKDVRVVAFSDPNEAVAAYRREKPDVFFIDHRLPQISGDQVALMFDDDIPKVLVTGALQVEPIAPFHSLLKKPFTAAQVRELLAELFDLPG